MSEFSLIDTLLSHMKVTRSDVQLGAGDDCALMTVPSGKQLAISTDTLVAGRHFPLDTPAHAIGHKALAVNLSDLAAMGAEPAWCSLALTLPDHDPEWLDAFCKGFGDLAYAHNLHLIGGDTTKGALSITVSICGFVDHDTALLRRGAQVGDDIYVSGDLGRPGYELRNITDPNARQRLNYPEPQVVLGKALVGIATAAIDVSDGLLGDVMHVLNASQVGAMIDVSLLPVSPAITHLPLDTQQELALSAGDEYQLCFTAPDHVRNNIQSLSDHLNIPLTRIGTIQPKDKGVCWQINGKPANVSHLNGYSHF